MPRLLQHGLPRPPPCGTAPPSARARRAIAAEGLVLAERRLEVGDRVLAALQVPVHVDERVAHRLAPRKRPAPPGGVHYEPRCVRAPDATELPIESLLVESTRRSELPARPASATPLRLKPLGHPRAGQAPRWPLAA